MGTLCFRSDYDLGINSVWFSKNFEHPYFWVWVCVCFKGYDSQFYIMVLGFRVNNLGYKGLRFIVMVHGLQFKIYK